ncbi:MAG: S-methyl-5-thioribose-1-phosphate isomerase [Planctomycetota bacterium]
MPPAIAWRGGPGGELLVLDQTRLPQERSVLVLKDAEGVAQAIERLSIRGAPAIGVAAAYALYLGVRQQRPEKATLIDTARHVAARLLATRPTAVNLRWAIERCLHRLRTDMDVAALLDEAHAIHMDDQARCLRMGEHGEALIPDGATVLTHCNAGRLATAGDGTALSVMFAAHRKGRRFQVLADETRPLLQGARLTALELAAEGIAVELLPDVAAASMIARGQVQLVIVGADRVATNGDFANKIGTYGLALAAAAHQVPFHVVAPLSTFDPALQNGAAIPIEERDPAEVLTLHGIALAVEGVSARNPAFDVTPGRLVTSFVTEQGILKPPYGPAIKAVLGSGR